MASKRIRVDYKQLHNFSSVVLYDKKRSTKQRTFPGTYAVERIIFRRKVKRDYEYLLKWEGWPLEMLSWEPEDHLNSELIREYQRPSRPSQPRLEEAARQLYTGILGALKSTSFSPIYIPMDLDIWRYVVQGKGIDAKHKGFKLYELDDTRRLDTLPKYWWYYLNQHGEGQAVKPPLKIKPVLSWSSAINIVSNGNMIKGARMPQEKLHIDILKRACNAQNL